MISEPIVSIRNRYLRVPAGRVGFTLLEILVAMMILAIVMGLVFGTFNGVFSSADHLNESGDLFEMADACLDRMDADLEGLHVMLPPRYQMPGTDSTPDPYRIEGGTESMGGNTFAKLRFTSLAHLALGSGASQGIAEIVYYVQPNESGGYTLYRADHLYPYPTFEPRETDPVMCDRLLAFKLIYYDKDGREYDAWNSEDEDYDYSTPQSIGIEIKLGDEKNSYLFRTAVTLETHRFISPDR